MPKKKVNLYPDYVPHLVPLGRGLLADFNFYGSDAELNGQSSASDNGKLKVESNFYGGLNAESDKDKEKVQNGNKPQPEPRSVPLPVPEENKSHKEYEDVDDSVLNDGKWIDIETLRSSERILIKMGFIKGNPLPKSQVDYLKRRIAYAIEYDMSKKLELVTPPIDAEIKWIFSDNTKIELPTLFGWRKNEARTNILLEESHFCKKHVYKNVVDGKILLGVLSSQRLLGARERANIYEYIRGMFFMNRSAMKMAEFDHYLNLTNYADDEENEGKLYFADVCAGPGGFTEYVFWRKKANATCFGFTLVGDLDFRIDDFGEGEGNNFTPHYGPAEDGNVNNPDNLNSYIKLVQEKTGGELVHFMLADGGFAVEGRETIQESLSSQIYLSQCLIALAIVRPGGSFVCKLFDVFTPFSVGLIYLMYVCFEKIAIHKPNTSRPANSERYLYCQFKKSSPNVDNVYQYLKKCHQEFWTFSNNSKSTHQWTITELVPVNHLKNCDGRKFYKYIMESNKSLGKQQLASLKNLISCYKDVDLYHKNRLKVKRLCLEKWDIPDQKEKNEANDAEFPFSYKDLDEESESESDVEEVKVKTEVKAKDNN